jgi:hypothetical protein
MDLSSIIDVAINFAQSNPKLAGFCTIAYLVGFGAKVIRESVEKFVAETPSKEDDKKLAEIESSKTFKAVSAVLDLFFRIKMK